MSPREISTITKRDVELMKLRDEVRKIIKTKRDWKRFVDYSKVYYEDTSTKK